MNSKQIAYQFGRLWNTTYDSLETLMVGITGFSGVQSALNLESMTDFNNMVGIGTSALVCIYLLPRAITDVSARIFLYHQLRKQKKDVNVSSMTKVEEVVIEDEKGLRSLLFETALCPTSEWGTLIKVQEDAGVARITHIKPHKEAEKEGLIKALSKSSMSVDINKAHAEGYRGHHHFHPGILDFMGYADYSLCCLDRVMLPSWMGLLSFNTREGPEIIAYNQQSVYIPSNKEKTMLVKAAPKDIMKYLS